MQKLVFTNGGGQTIDLTSGNFGITNWEGLSGTGLNIQTQQVPFQDGGVFLDALLEQREISVTVAIQDNNDLSLRYELKRQLISALNPKLGEGVLVYTNDYLSRQIKAVPQLPIFENKNSNDAGTLKASVVFSCPSPYWEDLNETRVNLKNGEQVTIMNNGDVETDINVEIFTNESIDVQIKNITEKKLVKLNGSINNNVAVNTNIGKKSVSKERLDISISNIAYDFNGIAYSDSLNLYLIIGGGRVLSSSDSTKWEIVENVQINANDIIYSNELGLFVIVGNSGKILTSSDGINWEEQNSGVSIHLRKVLSYNNGLVIVGNSGKILTSSDGIVWESQSSGVSENLASITYSDTIGLFVAVGFSGSILTSSDGIVWESQSSGVSGGLEDIWYSKVHGLFIAIGYGGAILTSTNGESWNIKTSGTTNSLFGISEISGKLVVCGIYGIILTSVDGNEWNFVETDFENSLRDVNYIYETGLIFIVGDNGLILASSDVISWDRYTLGIGINLTSVIYSKKQQKYFAVGNNIELAYVLSSIDGEHWNIVQIFSSISLRCITYSYELDLFIIVGSGGVYISSDGENWENVSTETDLNSVTYAKQLHMFVTVGRSKILFSSNGMDWDTINEGIPTTEFLSIAYSENVERFIVSTVNNYLLTSTDGITWNTISFTQDILNYIFYCKEKKTFIAGGSSKIFVSIDGITWNRFNINNGGSIRGITYSITLDMFVIVSSNGTVFTSNDLANWVNVESGNISYLSAVTYSEVNDSFVMCGNDGIILKSNFVLFDNLISLLSINSDMTLSLEKGENKLLLTRESGNLNGRISFRQKYIGV